MLFRFIEKQIQASIQNDLGHVAALHWWIELFYVYGVVFVNDSYKKPISVYNTLIPTINWFIYIYRDISSYQLSIT